MIRNILAVLLGIVAGMAANMALIYASLALYPLPEGLDPKDTEAYNGYLESLPATAFVIIMLAHVGQAFVGGWVAAKTGASRPMLLAMIIGVLSLAGGIAAMTIYHGPAWMKIELPLYLLVAWLAGTMVCKSRAKGT
tara:strand:- start:5636 stop:6046 length:411 start_codon:yes stop_codon:yes gene_type:complete